ncbi:Cyanovirin-N [Coniophora puteana RWD-64-598 SS2]|uniref:Cyanovirin-N n=1 Tax=Coniophora puteana (strain RWD-64-598) TaxID=741705 RepID=A0A5M3M9Q2_CONPW|nr:Cyanovirin-N [Coniophora puteana RWD-64-598 SS2]EIW75909.1 Cyanovirin-N [Coniophora puteana RWD-64-598 SS2]
MRFIVSQLAIYSIAAVMQISSVVADSGFGESCSSIEISYTTLSANCAEVDGSVEAAQIDLSTCIGNSNGQLACGVEYQETCSGCDYSGTVLYCECTNDSDQPVSTSIDLNTCIGDNNGELVC